MSEKFLEDEILRRDEKAAREVARLKEEAAKRPDDVDLQDRVTRKINKVLQEAKEKNDADKARIQSYDERLDAYEEDKIERRDERESKRSEHQTDIANDIDKIEEKVTDFFDEHDEKKINKLRAKKSLTEHEQKELARLEEKIKNRDAKLQEREQKRDDKLSAKQAKQVDETLERDQKDSEKIVKY